MDFASRECHAPKIRYRHRETVYHRDIVQPHAADGGKRDEVRVTVDGVERDGSATVMVDDHGEHWLEVRVRTI